MAWTSRKGALLFFKDVQLEYDTTDFQTNYKIKAGGALVLGQEQDGLYSGFSAEQSLRGSLITVNVWSYALPQQQTKRPIKVLLTHKLKSTLFRPARSICLLGQSWPIDLGTVDIFVKVFL